MLKFSVKAWCLCLCFAEAVWLLAAQVLGSMTVLIPCLVCFLALVVWAATRNMAMPVIMFFLPFAPLLKMRPGTISFFTIALLAVYAISTVIGSRNVWIFHLVPALALLSLTLVVKLVNGYEIDNSYILFAITLFLIPFLTREMDSAYDFYWLTLFLVLGIALSAITAQHLAAFPTISRYIVVNTSSGMMRWSGYYGDPNFYTTHITTALSGILIMLLHDTKKGRFIALILMVVVLIYCGLMSVSKSFLLVSACLFLFWVADLLLRRGKVSVKLTLVFTLLITGVFLLSSTVFTDMLGTLLGRFGRDSNISDFTTGRTELWVSYMTSILEDPLLLLFGQGYTDVTVGGEAAHNTLIQSIFQFGLVGCILMGAWAICFMKTLLGGARIGWDQAPRLFILLCGCLGPWMALDYLFFDELFLLPVYLCVGIRFLSQHNAAGSPLIMRKVGYGDVFRHDEQDPLPGVGDPAGL